MQVRDAREADADAIEALASGDIDVDHVLRERTVKVAVSTEAEPPADAADGDVVGFVAYDAGPDAVHVTRVGGSKESVVAVLDAPVAFAEQEGSTVEAVVPAGGAAATALETKGFADVGAGPRFEGRETRRYRREP